MATIGVMGAMMEEVALLEKDMRHVVEERRGAHVFIRGDLYGHNVVLVFSGWGKVAAAATTAILLDHYGVDRLIFTGVAGGIADGLEVGDFVVGTRFVQHDLDARPIFPKRQIPLLGVDVLEADARLSALALEGVRRFLAGPMGREIPEEQRANFGIRAPKVTAGLVASGDQFINSVAQRNELLAAMPDLLCVEMEGAAVAQVCAGYNIPMALLRVISDRADHSAHIDFAKFISDIALRFTRGAVREMMALM